MTQIVQRLEIHCPYVRALQYFNGYLAHLGWTEQSNVVPLHLNVPLGPLGIGQGMALEKEVIATFERSPKHRGLEDTIAVTWRPEEANAPFPTFDGSLSLRAGTPKSCVLFLEGGYEPPFGVAGKVFDAALGHRIADATAIQLLKEIGESIELSFVQDEPHLSR
ncbi:MAG TPA: hypothetical protein VII69_13495 [Candidatus Eremiobacteraceae bacterium]